MRIGTPSRAHTSAATDGPFWPGGTPARYPAYGSYGGGYGRQPAAVGAARRHRGTPERRRGERRAADIR